jgi:hypothetical protein
MYHYVYRLDHLETNEYYFGSRSSEMHPSLDPYMGSMKKWKPDKAKLRKTTIKDDFKTRIDAILFESNLISNHINNELNRNYHIPPHKFYSLGFVSVKDSAGNVLTVLKTDPKFLSGELVGVFTNRKHTEIAKQKMRDYHKFHHSNQGEKNSQFGTIWITNEFENKKIKKDSEIPIGWRCGCINKKMIGYHWINNDIINKKLKLKENLPTGWKYGRLI